jgi:putative endonuclease
MTSTAATIGQLGETLVRDWLQTQQYQILYQRWHCRGGELDLVAMSADGTIALVEVKTRSARNWDRDGLLAIASRKQKKLIHAANLFMAAHPHWVDRAYRFDVALVHCRPATATSSSAAIPSPLYRIITQGYQLSLHTYIDNAF